VKKEHVINGKMLQGDALLEMFKIVSPLFSENKLDIMSTLKAPLG
jgi:hypothetical protein